MVNHTAVAAELAEAGGNHSGGHGHGSSGSDSVSAHVNLFRVRDNDNVIELQWQEKILKA